MRSSILLLAALVLSSSTRAADEPPSQSKWMAMSECWKNVEGRRGDAKLKVGISTFDLDRASCEAVGKAKATGMVTGGWFCFGDEKRPMEVSHICAPITQAEEDLGLRDVRRRAPVMNTYLAFTDLDGHLTQVSFWDLPSAVANQLCEAFRQDISQSGVKDVQCVLGKT